VLGSLPKSAHPGAKKALAEIWNAEDRRHALDAVTSFKTAYGAKFGKAVAKITDDLDQLLAFYDFPAEHWIHLRATNPIESTFATVRHRTKIDVRRLVRQQCLPDRRARQRRPAACPRG
jgi:transposase-like protein